MNRTSIEYKQAEGDEFKVVYYLTDFCKEHQLSKKNNGEMDR